MKSRGFNGCTLKAVICLKSKGKFILLDTEGCTPWWTERELWSVFLRMKMNFFHTRTLTMWSYFEIQSKCCARWLVAVLCTADFCVRFYFAWERYTRIQRDGLKVQGTGDMLRMTNLDLHGNTVNSKCRKLWIMLNLEMYLLFQAQ